MKSTSASSAARSGPGRIRLDSSSTAMCAFLRVTTAPPMKVSAHQAVARDLLGPGQAVVEDVAGEELQEDDEGERPEQHEREPVLRMVLDHDLFVLGDDQVDVVGGAALVAWIGVHGGVRFRSSSPANAGTHSHWRFDAERRRSLAAPRLHGVCGPSVRRDDRCECLLQRLQRVVLRLGPAGAGAASLCSGIAALRKASRSTVDHGLAELARIRRRVFCSESRI